MPIESSQEEKWMLEAKSGNLLAFEKLISHYEHKIYQICFHLLGDYHEAYDVSQEVCIKIWRQLDQFRGEAKIGTWIYKIATNTCLDWLRKQKRRQSNNVYKSVMSDTEQKKVEKEHCTGWEDMSAQLLEKERQQVLWQGIYELKKNHRVLIVLKDIENYSYEEIAAILDLSIGTVKSRLSRARIQLKKILEQDKEPYQSFFASSEVDKE